MVSAASAKGTPPEQVQLALAAAIDVPRQAAKLALAVLGDLQALAGACNRWLLSDLMAAAVLAAATARLSHYNVLANTGQLEDAEAAAQIQAASAQDTRRAALLADAIEIQATSLMG